MCSRTRRVSGTRPTCSMAPVRMRFSGLVGSPPKTRTLPESGWRSPKRSLTAVVLPAPFGAEESQNFSSAHAEVDAAQGSDVSIVFVDAFQVRNDDIGGAAFGAGSAVAIMFVGLLRCSRSAPPNCIIEQDRSGCQCHPSCGGGDKCHSFLGRVVRE